MRPSFLGVVGAKADVPSVDVARRVWRTGCYRLCDCNYALHVSREAPLMLREVRLRTSEGRSAADEKVNAGRTRS